MGVSGPSLLIESTDSMIQCVNAFHYCDNELYVRFMLKFICGVG